MPRVPGYYSSSRRRPYVGVVVYLPRFDTAAGISFLIDTGADTTAVHWGDLESFVATGGGSLASDLEFESMSTAAGLSGDVVEYGIEPAILFFTDESGDVAPMERRIRIAVEPRVEGIPSLLGRDVLADMRLDFNMPADELTLEW